MHTTTKDCHLFFFFNPTHIISFKQLGNQFTTSKRTRLHIPVHSTPGPHYLIVFTCNDIAFHLICNKASYPMYVIRLPIISVHVKCTCTVKRRFEGFPMICVQCKCMYIPHPGSDHNLAQQDGTNCSSILKLLYSLVSRFFDT